MIEVSELSIVNNYRMDIRQVVADAMISDMLAEMDAKILNSLGIITSTRTYEHFDYTPTYNVNYPLPKLEEVVEAESNWLTDGF